MWTWCKHRFKHWCKHMCKHTARALCVYHPLWGFYSNTAVSYLHVSALCLYHPLRDFYSNTVVSYIHFSFHIVCIIHCDIFIGHLYWTQCHGKLCLLLCIYTCEIFIPSTGLFTQAYLSVVFASTLECSVAILLKASTPMCEHGVNIGVNMV